MTSVTCRHCGLPFRVSRVEPGKDYFCCTGCAILSRIPVDGRGNYPVNAHLISALALAFLYFNQLLFWAMSVLLAREGRLVLAERFAWIGTGAALCVWLGVVIVQRREGAARRKDILFGALSLLLLLAACRSLPPVAPLLAAANAVWLVWSFRGVLRKRVTR